MHICRIWMRLGIESKINKSWCFRKKSIYFVYTFVFQLQYYDTRGVYCILRALYTKLAWNTLTHELDCN